MNALWIDLPADAMNVAAAFRLVLGRPAGGATLRLAAADFCRVWVDGRLAAHGPARTAHGYARVEEVPLHGDFGGAAAFPAAAGGDFKAEGRFHEHGALVVFVEVLSAHVPCFDGVEQDAFFAAEVVAPDGRVLAGTDDFEAWLDGTLVRRVRRFSYQRGFVESRRIAADPGAFRRGGPAPEGWTRAATVPRPLPRLLPRRAPRPVLDFLDAGAPVARGTFSADASVAAPMGREVTLVGTQGFKGYSPAEWEDDPAADAARLASHAENAESAESANSSSLRTFSLYDLRRTRTGFFSLRVRAEAPEGATVLLLFDELRAPDGARFRSIRSATTARTSSSGGSDPASTTCSRSIRTARGSSRSPSWRGAPRSSASASSPTRTPTPRASRCRRRTTRPSTRSWTPRARRSRRTPSTC